MVKEYRLGKGRKLSEMSCVERFLAGCQNPRPGPHLQKAIRFLLGR